MVGGRHRVGAPSRHQMPTQWWIANVSRGTCA